MKTSRFLAYVDTVLVVLLSAYVILILYNRIVGSLVVPSIFAIVYFICLLLNKNADKNVKIRNLLTVLPTLILSIVATIKK